MSLAKRSASAALWNYAGNALRIFLQFGVGIILARLIGPHEFGLVAVAILMVGFGQMFVDFGFNAAIVQTRELCETDISSLGTLQILIGAMMMVLTFLGAGTIAWFFHLPDALPIIRWMGLMFFLRAIGQNAVALLNRDLRFREVQIGMMSGYLIGYLTLGLPMAYAGYGAWSIVVAQLFQTAISSFIAIGQIGRFHALSLHGLRREMLNFGRLVISANLGSWAVSNLDAIVVGNVVGPLGLAFYNRSMMLANSPTQAILSGLQGVLFAASSRVQDNPDACRRAFYACVELMILLSGPVLFSISVVTPTVLLALYGPQWVAAAPLLTPLCIASVINGVLGFFGPMIMGLGRIERETRAQWLAALAMLPTVFLVAHISASAVAWSIVALYLLRFSLLWYGLNAILTLDLKVMARAVIPGLLVAGIAATGSALADHLTVGCNPMERLGLDVAAAGGGTVLGIVALRRTLFRGELGALLLNNEFLPGAIKKWLNPLATTMEQI